MKNQIKRLRLQEGDIVVVRDQRTLETLRKLPIIKNMPRCVILFSPHSIHRLSKEYLKKLVANA